MKKFLSILLIGLFAVALVFAQEKATKPEKAEKKMECCKESKGDCSKECAKMKAEGKECTKACKGEKKSASKKATK